MQDHPWDNAAEGWSQHSALIREWLSEATTAMLSAACIEPGDRVLDIAAGAGDQTADIARRVGPGGAVLATDVSARILALAQVNLQVQGFVHVATRQADAQALGLANAGFDAAVCRLGLMFCPQPLLALRGIRDALKPGGRFSAIVFASPQSNPCITISLSTASRHAGVLPVDPYAPGSLLSLGLPGLLESLLDQAGFEAIEVSTLAAPFRTIRCQDYVDFVRSAGSPVIEILRPLSPDARAAAWADIAHQLDRFSTAGGWVGPNELLMCSAVTPQV
jgi:SAM-dependent methyltransferase